MNDKQQEILRQDRFRGCMLGLACGDAVGTTTEFMRRGSFPAVTDMVGGGPFDLKRGQWTDDTSMALCLAQSLIDRQGFDAHDQMTKYVRWMDEGYMSSNGRCFDIGQTTLEGLDRFKTTGEPFSDCDDALSAGNGCLMRLAPVPMWFYPDRLAVIEYAAQSSRTTHGAAECIDASRLFAAILYQALSGADKDAILFGHGLSEFDIPSYRVQSVAAGDYRDKGVAEIRGSGYVVESLEAALWCFLTTDTFESAILAAANLGDDADTTAAICGQVAGAFYGENGLPCHWLRYLVMAREIRLLADKLGQRRGDNNPI
jgi:ADP-ribosyl-[dinitrogen reductase] hydrolase